MQLCLRRKIPPLGLHKGILNSSLLLILLIHTKHKHNKMKTWNDLTSSFPWKGALIHLVNKTKNVWLIVRQLLIKAGWGDASLALSTHFNFVFIFLSFMWLMILSWIFTTFSAREARLGRNIFVHLQSGQLLFTNPCFHKLCYHMSSLAIGSHSHTFYPRQSHLSADFLTIRPCNVSVFRVYSNPYCHNFFLEYPSLIQIPILCFRFTSKWSTQPSWRQRCKEYYPSLNMKPWSSKILKLSPLMALPFFQ